MNGRSLSRQKPAAMRQRAEEFRSMAEAARTEDEADVMPDRQAIVRSLRVLADRFDRFAEQLETAGGEGFRPGDDASFVLAPPAKH
jgi:hypothetical protein